MLTRIKKRSALLLSVAVVCATVAIVPQTASAAASIVPNVGTAVVDPFSAPADTTLYQACPGDSAPAAGFTDTTSTDVDCIKMFGITQGMPGGTTYEPDGTIPRWQMALFIHRMFVPAGLAAAGLTPVPAFTDISGLDSDINAAVSALASHKITLGTGDGTTFSPNDNVTREQMAMFLNRFKALVKDSAGSAIAGTKTTGTFNYGDIASTSYEGMESIVQLYNLGVTGETCTALSLTTCSTTYRPAEDITRAEMASMVTALLNHTNARPAGVSIQSFSANAAAGATISTQVSVRNTDHSAQSNTLVDIFSQIHNDLSTVAAQPAITALVGTCTKANVTNFGGTVECSVDANDSVTNVYGNIVGPTGAPGANATFNVYAHTGATGTAYVDGTTTEYDTYSNGWGATATVVYSGAMTVSSSGGLYALTDNKAGHASITATDLIREIAGGSETFTATLTPATAGATIVAGYSLKEIRSTVDAAGNVTVATNYHPVVDGSVSWTLTCPADDSLLTSTYNTQIHSTLSMGALVDVDGLPSGAAAGNAATDPATAITYVGIGHAAGGNHFGVNCEDNARAYAEGSTGESLAINSNRLASSVAGSLVSVTATAYDQYGDGIAGVEVELASTSTSNNADTDNGLQARLLTGAGGTASLSAVICAGTVDKVTWRGIDTDSAATNEMDLIPASAAGASAVQGTTVYCTTAATDGVWQPATKGNQTWAWVTSAALHLADDATVAIAVGGIGTGTWDTSAASATYENDIAAAINSIVGITGVACVDTGAAGTTTTCTFADGSGLIGDGTVTLTLTDAPHVGAGAAYTTTSSTVVVGVDQTSHMHVEDDPSNDTMVTLRKVSGDTGTLGAVVDEWTYMTYAYDSGDAYTLNPTDAEIATGCMGCSVAEFEAALAALTGEAGATLMSGSYRISALGTQVSFFNAGS